MKQKIQRKITIVMIAITVLFCFSACANQSDNSVELVKHYGQEKVEEMDVECTDEKQVEIAKNLIEKAKQIMSFTGAKEKADTSNDDALEKYYLFNQDNSAEAVSAKTNVELITTKQENGTGYIWVKYDVSYYDKANLLITGSSDIISRWEIALKDGHWTVTNIDDMP